MQAGLPTKTVNHLERIVRVFHPLYRFKRGYAKQSSVLMNLRKALLLQLKVVLHYRKPGFPRRQPYHVDPYTLLLYQSGLYLRGFSHGANAMRTFAVERIRQVDLLDERFEIPSAFSSEDFGDRLFGLIDEVPQRVRIHFTREVAYQLRERQWHPTQKLTRQKNGSVILTLDAGGLDEIASWILSWGPQAKVLEPPELVKLVKRELTKAIRRYGILPS
jgi:proteasome accessory factor B